MYKCIYTCTLFHKLFEKALSHSSMDSSGVRTSMRSVGQNPSETELAAQGGNQAKQVELSVCKFGVLTNALVY